MRIRQIVATLVGGGIGQVLPFTTVMVALQFVLANRKGDYAISPLAFLLTTAALIVVGIVTTAIVFLGPFWWMAKRRRLSFLSALLTGAVAGTLLAAVAFAIWWRWWHVASGPGLGWGIGFDMEVLALCGAVGAWAGWRLTEPKRVLTVETSEMF